jgi:hypothetical protein
MVLPESVSRMANPILQSFSSGQSTSQRWKRFGAREPALLEPASESRLGPAVRDRSSLAGQLGFTKAPTCQGAILCRPHCAWRLCLELRGADDDQGLRSNAGKLLGLSLRNRFRQSP